MIKNKNMKKKSLLFCCLMTVGAVLSNAKAFGGNELFEVEFDVRFSDPTGNLGGHPRTPVSIPSVTQDGHAFYFNNVGYDLELVLLDEDGDEVYYVPVPVGTSAVVLPSTLSGEYELQLYPTDSIYYFYGYVTL